MPRSMNHFQQASTHSVKSLSACSAVVKYSISICSNSRVRKMKLPGVISLRNALPIWPMPKGGFMRRSEEHTSELQSRGHLVCRLLLEKKKQYNINVLIIRRLIGHDIASLND